jgi:hypothetical protein
MREIANYRSSLQLPIHSFICIPKHNDRVEYSCNSSVGAFSRPFHSNAAGAPTTRELVILKTFHSLQYPDLYLDSLEWLILRVWTYTPNENVRLDDLFLVRTSDFQGYRLLLIFKKTYLTFEKRVLSRELAMDAFRIRVEEEETAWWK